ncbi:PP2C family protein-serine/threonine phosphatase [Pseudofrankia sp. BMG5.36]|uniref:PP2C family protein-serine/threonine phosphatase n=1 Tax=Pseudofrankia sp. BMG5.36 TaxID=1834512 RepID=UPI0008DA054A|nr:PP2C family protein-serine/threonine phosphatase [Pseudofrankia sp. BMG5.36]OHV46021.1 hypothetical protein BCD48_20955 [Pseudofrankia sp. BMG5.36]
MGRAATKNAHKAGHGGPNADLDWPAATPPGPAKKPRGARHGGKHAGKIGKKAGKRAAAAAAGATSAAGGGGPGRATAAAPTDPATASGSGMAGGTGAAVGASGAVVDAIIAAALGEAVAESLTDTLTESINESFTEMMAGGLASALEQALAQTVSAAVAHELPGALAAAAADARAHHPDGAPGSAAPSPPRTAAATPGDADLSAVFPAPSAAGEHTVALAAARSVWESLPPRRLPVLPGLDLAARRAAASDPERVGGDWYDVTAFSADTAVLDVGDVGGHGPGAAALMAELCHATRAYALLDLPPSEITTRLADVLFAGGHRAITSAVTARLDVPTGHLTWCNAGHPPPVLVGPDGAVSFLGDMHGPLLGAVPGAGPGVSVGGGLDTRAGTEYAQSTVTMPVGATVLFYSAGLVDGSGTPLAERLDALAAAVSRAFATRLADAGANGAGHLGGASGPPLTAACDALLAELSGGRPPQGREPAAGSRQDGDACLLAARIC